MTITISTGRAIPVRWVAEQHVKEDLGWIPTAADWLRAIQPEPWMNARPSIRLGAPMLMGTAASPDRPPATT